MRGLGNSILAPPNPCQPAVSIVDSDGVYLSGNSIRSGGGGMPVAHGILVDAASSGTLLQQNTVSGFGGDGIRLEGNRCVANAGAGAWFANSSGHIYRDNILTANTGGPVAGPGTPDVTDAGSNAP